MNQYQKLQAFITRAQQQQRPFQWGQWDCCLFVADALNAMTGQQFADGFRGHYYTERSAKKHLIKLGYRDMQEVFTAHFGPAINTTPVPMAVPVAMNTYGQITMGVTYDQRAWSVSQAKGVTCYPLGSVLCHWNLEETKW